MTHVELQHITIGYGHRVLLEDVSAAIGGGRLVALLGRNGTGKSTLLRAVALASHGFFPYIRTDI